ncbi:MAG: DinB family protein [Streptosporangiales bacterium]|nr:DinB family protein [Streptosporangiales bacterium]
MPDSRCALFRWQFDLTWSLVDFHLGQLEPDDHLWEPAPLCWSVRPSPDGRWLPDWQVPEPDPVPVPTVAWVTWHIGWWWSVTLNHVQGRTPRDRTDVTWPDSGDAAIAWLRDLRTEWTAVLDNLTDDDLDAVAPFPWQDSEHTVGQLLGWVNAELMKNGAEIGQLRMLRAASSR